MIAVSTTRNKSLCEKGTFFSQIGKNVVSTARNLFQEQEGILFYQNGRKECLQTGVVA